MNRAITILTTALLGSLVLLGAAAPATSGAPGASKVDMLPPPPASRTIVVDGRAYTVTLQVLRFIPGAMPDEGDPTAVTAYARVLARDGALLPEGLRLARVRFERLFGSDRVFFAKLTQAEVSIANGFEDSERLYRADVASRTKGVRRLKATVRLEIDGRVFPVNFGTVPVSNAGLFQ